ncbi:MAG: ABC transporter ATP-binding protein [Saccharofermentanales bacterium]|jgi:branched-chain amino acid transport system ATP-binding protein
MAQPILRLEGLTKYFGGVTAAEDVNFAIYPGQIRGLIGPNGAGKTTIMNLICGIYEADKGEIYFDEEPISKLPDYKRARLGIGRTFQQPRFLQRSNIRENLLIGSDLDDQMGYMKSFFSPKTGGFEAELAELMKVAGFEVDIDDEISGLPYGQLKLLEIVRSMLSHPKVMLVDEPAAGLNGAEQNRAMDLLNLAASQNIGVVLIEHSMDMVMNLCHEITVLNFGCVIAEGSPAEISKNKTVIEAYLGRRRHAAN